MNKREHTLQTLARYIGTAQKEGWHVEVSCPLTGSGTLDSFTEGAEGLHLKFGDGGRHAETITEIWGEENGAIYGVSEWGCFIRVHAQVVRDDSARRKHVRADQVTPDDLNYAGKRFGLLVVESVLGWDAHSRLARCRCDCGGAIDTRISSLSAGITISCGCRRGKNTELPLAAGDRYGLLTVIEQVSRPEGQKKKEGYYRLKCDCGTEVIRRRWGIVTGDKPDCGCKGLPLLVGQRFGLLVIEPGSRSVGRVREVMTRCDCGQTAYANLWALKSGKKRSCGCLKQGPRRQVSREPC